jgi:DnaJ-class molecular chaperone
MKWINEQTYYEILEISPEATPKEIQKAYEHAKEAFRHDSIAIYTLFSNEEIQEIQEAIEEAYRVLMNEATRKEYDQIHRERIRGTFVKEESRRIEREEEKGTALSFKEIALHLEEMEYRGKSLKEVRERLGIDLKSISEETKIHIKMLQAIEEEDLPNLPPLVYLKGFLKAYAKLLNLDPQKVIEGYLRVFHREGGEKKR